MPKIAIYALAGLMFLAIPDWPYEFYMVLRVVAFAAFMWAAYTAYGKGMNGIFWVLAVLVLLFNPFLPILLPKEVWMFVDVFAGVFLVAVAGKISNAPEKVKE